jgi:hypothetical protein
MINSQHAGVPILLQAHLVLETSLSFRLILYWIRLQAQAERVARYNCPVPLLCDLCVRSGKYRSYMVPLERLTVEGKPESDHPYRCGSHTSREYSKFLGYYSNYPIPSERIPPPLSFRCECRSTLHMYVSAAQSQSSVTVKCIECGVERDENL